MNKICNRCKEEKDTSLFHFRKSTKDWFYNTCKECRKVDSKQYYDKNREDIIEYNTEFFKNNREKLYQYKRDWYKNNPEKVKAQFDRKKKTESYRINNRINKHKRRELLKNLWNDWTVTKSSLIELFNSINNCIYCGIDRNDNFHLDHINPLVRWWLHTITNLRFICPSCNLKKYTRNHAEFCNILLPSSAANLTAE